MDPSPGLENYEIAQCGGAMEIALDVFVIVKALILVAVSLQGVKWFLNKNYMSLTVIIILLVSCALVSINS